MELAVDKKFSFGLRKASDSDLKLIEEQKNKFNIQFPNRFSILESKNTTTTFVAFNNKRQIVGFVNLLIDGRKEGMVVSLYTRVGYERLGIGQKLLGKANGFFIRNKVTKARLWSSTMAREFYKNHTNYKVSSQLDPNPLLFETELKSNPRKRVKPIKVGPQSPILKKGFGLKRRK